MTVDGMQGLTIGYNLLNLPSKVTKTGITATYRYIADGVKLEAKVSSGTSNAPAGQPTAYAYLGSLVYSKIGDSYQLESTDFSGARYYNPTIARWTTIDPKAEKYYSTTPYSYCAGNPVMYVDPDGEALHIVAGALIGAAINATIALYKQESLEDIGVAAIKGAIEGGVCAATGGIAVRVASKIVTGVAKKVITSAFTGAVSSAAGSAAEQYYYDGEVSGTQLKNDAFIGAAAGAVAGGVSELFNDVATKAVTSDSHANSLRNAFKHENRVMGRSNSNSNLSKAVSETVEAEKNVIEVGAGAINNVTSSAVTVINDELR